MEFEFIIDKIYLLLKMISNRKNLEELNRWKHEIIANILDSKVIEEIEARKADIEEYFIRGEFEQMVRNNTLDSKIDEIFQDVLFNKYYNETLAYFNSLQDNWLNNKEKINSWLKETIKLNPSQKITPVYVSHPTLNTGKCVDQQYIFWGHYKGIKDINYNLTYLCHENLHSLLPNANFMPPTIKLYYDKESNISFQEHWKNLNSSIENYYQIFDFEFDMIHAVIELISDNELYTILSKESKYKEGHNNPDFSLVKYKKLIFPYWFDYLGLSSREIHERVPEFNDENMELIPKENIIDIEKFIEFLINNADIRTKLEVPDLPSSKLNHWCV